MEAELQELRDLVAQLRADNDKLRQEQSHAAPSSPIAGPSRESVVPPIDQPVSASATLTERLVFIPRDRKCPIFDGRSGIGINEWIEEAKACIRTRHLSVADQAFFLFDHLGGNAREEVRHRPVIERGDPERIFSILQELYGCSQSYVALQEAFFSRKQQEGETLLEFSLALLSLLEKVRQKSPNAMPNAEILLRDQFVEYVCDPLFVDSPILHSWRCVAKLFVGSGRECRAEQGVEVFLSLWRTGFSMKFRAVVARLRSLK
ncbi:uncharacterized protein LOC124392654 [Silurus meridionalis]|uniref:uncharacterized protein LOC124392654 n=1 Tax=Silurus meridionalis TaxID=175797 RepID=UPI001EEAD86F|nr:uncharacterized protein LOC124392654 [Silurus meridionalis]